MTRKEAKDFYPILQAFAEGKVIECRTKPSSVKGTDIPNDWTEMKRLSFGIIQSIASSPSQSTDRSLTRKSAGKRCRNTNR